MILTGKIIFMAIIIFASVVIASHFIFRDVNEKHPLCELDKEINEEDDYLG